MPTAGTPAGQMLELWLDAFNSGDKTRIQTFDNAHVPWLTPNRSAALRAQTGGYELLNVEANSRLWITFRVKEKATGIERSGSLVIKSNTPAIVSLLSFSSPDTKTEAIGLDEAERSRLVENISKLLNQIYVFPDEAKRFSAELVKRFARGDYQGITNGDVFASRLTDDLRAISGDKHFSVGFSTTTFLLTDLAITLHPVPSGGNRTTIADLRSQNIFLQTSAI